MLGIRARRVVLGVAVVAVIGACGGDRAGSDTTSMSASSSTLSSVATSPTTAGGEEGYEATGTAGAADDGVTGDGELEERTGPATSLPPPIPPYQVIHRLIIDGRTTLVILLEPGSYTTVQLENLVFDVVDEYSPHEAIVVDDPGVADLAISDQLTVEQQETLDAGTVLRIEDGVEVTFYGPYAAAGGMTVGS